MIRSRAERRRRLREEAKQMRAVRRELVTNGVAKRAEAANRIVAPDSPVFWHALKARIAARESLRELRSLEQVRDIALAILAEEGADLRGLVLKVEWSPPVLTIEAVPEHGTALAAIERAAAGAR